MSVVFLNYILFGSYDSMKNNIYNNCSDLVN